MSQHQNGRVELSVGFHSINLWLSLAAAAADFTFQWIASSDNAHHNAGFCNYDWPVRDLPSSLCLGLI
jgi:hypothetical protein